MIYEHKKYEGQYTLENWQLLLPNDDVNKLIESGELYSIIDDKLEKWKEVSNQLAVLKEQEMALRKEIVDGYFPVFKEGTNKVETPSGILTYQARYNKSIIIKDVEELEGIIEEYQLQDIFKKKYEVNSTAYNKLDDATKNNLKDLIEVKLGAPQLSIK